MGPRPGNVARGIYSVLFADDVIFSLGNTVVCASLSAQSTGRRAAKHYAKMEAEL